MRLDKETPSHTEVKAAFYSHFTARRDTIVEQVPEESVDTSIQDFYLIAEDCKYGTPKDLLSRDRIAQESSSTLYGTLLDLLPIKKRTTLLLLRYYQQGNIPTQPLCLGVHNQAPCNGIVQQSA